LPLTTAQVAALSPDASSLDAARKLLKPAVWPLRAADAEGRAIWGECQGSGATPYRVTVDLADNATKCTCPSRKFPCKHALALMWQHAERAGEFSTDAWPAWAGDWLGKRKPKANALDGVAIPSVPLSSAEEPPVAPADPEAAAKAEARAAAQRDRLRKQREAAVLAGLDDLDRWIGDRLDAGLAGFAASAVDQCRTVARRLVDAKAAALAARVDELPSRLLRLPDEQRPRFLVEELGTLHLLAAAYRNQEALPPPLRADVRRMIGWTTERAALLEDPEAPRHTDTWRVLSGEVVTQPDGLLRAESWLVREGEAADAPRFASLVDFAPASAGAKVAAMTPGERFEGEVCWFPSAAPQRALIARRAPASAPESPLTGPDVATALDLRDLSLDANPFQIVTPVAVRGWIAEAGGQLWLSDDGAALPLVGVDRDEVIALLGHPGAWFGLWDGRGLRLRAGDVDGLGAWYAQ
jgi:hypothetical protein